MCVNSYPISLAYLVNSSSVVNISNSSGSVPSSSSTPPSSRIGRITNNRKFVLNRSICGRMVSGDPPLAKNSLPNETSLVGNSNMLVSEACIPVRPTAALLHMV